jgi:hypothetical protein
MRVLPLHSKGLHENPSLLGLPKRSKLVMLSWFQVVRLSDICLHLWLLEVLMSVRSVTAGVLMLY